MKKPIILLILGFFFVRLACAQTEINLNISNILFYEFNAAAEIGLNKYLGLGVFGSYAYGFPVEDDQIYKDQNAYFGPELKIYVNPNKGLDGFFIGLYLKEAFGTVSTIPENFDNSFVLPINSSSSSYSKLAGGLLIGGKRVFDNNIVIQFFGGLGRNLYTQFNDETVQESYYNYNGNFSKYFDFRFGFMIGYRFK